MGNHEINCKVCDSDMRPLGSTHEDDCPGENASLEKKIIYTNLERLRYEARAKEQESWEISRAIEGLKSDLRTAS